MPAKQNYQKDLDYIAKIDKFVSPKVEFMGYFLTLAACLAAHALYLAIFAAAGVMAMVVFNIFSVTFYAGTIVAVSRVKEKTYLVYASLAEIVIHAAAATVCVGAQADFIMFLLMIIPLAFLMPNKNRYAPFVVMFVTVPLYGLLRFTYMEPGRELYNISDTAYPMIFYVINILVGAFVLMYVATIYTVINRYTGCKLRVQNEQLRVMASTDPLTKLDNRRAVGRKLAETAALCDETGKGYVVGIADLDDFKRVNDNFGHDMGDHVLEAAAGVIKDTLPEGGYASRWGGEEFLFVLPETGLQQGVATAEQMIKSVSELSFTSEDGTISVTVTIGICEGQPGDNVERVIGRADSRLYKGKNDGKNRVEFED
ncbi:MAG: GGDEF domain-containing protein [Ruminococcus sp.]|nr:GGDEF domain-containing protein [Ruminococcus sp.]